MLNKQHIELIQTKDLEAISGLIKKELSKRKRYEKLKKREKFVSSLNPIPHNNDSLFEHNSSTQLALPNHNARRLRANAAHLPALIMQDWTPLYSGGSKDNNFYVYVHVDPTKSVFVAPACCGGNYGGQPFYVGKGSGGRAYDLKRNQGHGKYIREIKGKGIRDEKIVKIVFDGLTEAKAYEIEAKLIYYFGTIYSKSVKKKGFLVNLDVPKTPNFVGVMLDSKKEGFENG